MRIITINSGKKISLKTYIQAWKQLKNVPANKRETTNVKESLTTWYPVTVEECLKQYMDGVHDRINLKGLNILSYRIKV